MGLISQERTSRLDIKIPCTKLSEINSGYQRRVEIPQADRSQAFENTDKIESSYPTITSSGILHMELD